MMDRVANMFDLRCFYYILTRDTKRDLHLLVIVKSFYFLEKE